jgi:hypothetical protein
MDISTDHVMCRDKLYASTNAVSSFFRETKTPEKADTNIQVGLVSELLLATLNTNVRLHPFYHSTNSPQLTTPLPGPRLPSLSRPNPH